MIRVETVTINREEFTYTYSDSGYKVERDGVLYDEAYDPVDLERKYIESDVKKEAYEDNDDYAEAGKILMGVSE